MREVLRRKLLYIYSTEYETIMIGKYSKNFPILTIPVSSWSRSLSPYTFTQDHRRVFRCTRPSTDHLGLRELMIDVVCGGCVVDV